MGALLTRAASKLLRRHSCSNGSLGNKSQWLDLRTHAGAHISVPARPASRWKRREQKGRYFSTSEYLQHDYWAGDLPKNWPQFLPAAPFDMRDTVGYTKPLIRPPELSDDNLFHPYSGSPFPEFRRRAAVMRQHAYCPHPDHELVHLPEISPEAKEHHTGHQPPAHVNYECPDCGIPVYCSKEHWMDHYEEHLRICEVLRQINEDDHDIRSRSFFREGLYPDMQMEGSRINMHTWDTYLYSRDHDAVNSERHMRQLTRLLTYPLTIASVIHDEAPYTSAGRPGGRVTGEGLKSFAEPAIYFEMESALRYNLHPTKERMRLQPPPIRIFILGARAESSLPRAAWMQLSYLFPGTKLHLIMIGPESMMNRDNEFPLPERTAENPWGAVVEDEIWHELKISTIVDYYHTIHKTGYFAPFDPYFDCFMLYHPGLGHPSSQHEWAETLPLLLETKVPIISTGYTPYDMVRDVEWVKKTAGGEFDILLEPGENIFRSLRWDLNDVDPQDISCANWGVWAFRGKRYEATKKDSREEEDRLPVPMAS